MLTLLAAIDTGLAVTRSHAGYGGSTASITLIAGRILQAGLALIGIAFLIMMLYGGILWLTAGGEKGNVEKASRLLRNAVIGTVVIVASYSLASYLIGALTAVLNP